MKASWCKITGVLILVTSFFAAALSWEPREPVHQGKPLSYWLTELKNANPARQQQAGKALREIGVQAVPFLLRMARKESSVLKRWHREAWFRLPDCVRTHLAQPESEDAALNHIGHALHQLGPAAGPALMKAMEDKNASVRYVAGTAFPYRDDSPMAVSWDLKLLQTADYDLKQSAAAILGTMGSKAKPAIRALLEVVKHDKTDYVRETAARSVAAIVDSQMSSAAPEIASCLNDHLAAVRLWSAVALWRIDHDPAAIAVLNADLKSVSAEDGTCHAVIRVLGEAGALAKPAVPAIRAIMLRFDPERAIPEGGAALVVTAREALARIDPEAVPEFDVRVP